MLNITEAVEIMTKNLPDREIQRATPFRGDLFIFLAPGKPGTLDADMDPYYSVNRKTKEFKEFSIVDGTTPKEVMLAFAEIGVEMKKK